VSELCASCMSASIPFQPGFGDAVVRLRLLLESLERDMPVEAEMSGASREAIFGLLDGLYAELRASTQPLDDDFDRVDIKTRHVHAFRALVGSYLWQAPFFRRSYEKPRGYAGDFEMMEMLYDARVEGQTPFARLLQEYFMRGEGPCSVRSRREYLRNLLVTKIAEGRVRRVLSVAAGSAAEVRDLFRDLSDAEVEVYLLDRDEGALAFARKALEDQTGASCRVRELVMSVRDVAEGALTKQKAFDFVYSTGLYDYLAQPFATALTRRLVECLAPSGELVIANYANEHVNPDRFIVEYAQDWFLVTRTAAEMYGLLDGSPVEDVRLKQDAATGSIHFLSARRRA